MEKQANYDWEIGTRNYHFWKEKQLQEVLNNLNSKKMVRLFRKYCSIKKEYWGHDPSLGLITCSPNLITEFDENKKTYSRIFKKEDSFFYFVAINNKPKEMIKSQNV